MPNGSHARALPGAGPQLEPRPDRLGPLGHDAEPEAAGPRRLGVESAAVVGDDELESSRSGPSTPQSRRSTRACVAPECLATLLSASCAIL